MQAPSPCSALSGTLPWHSHCSAGRFRWNAADAGPFIKLGPLRNVGSGVAERAGCLSGAGLVVILTVCLAMYGATAFQVDQVPMGVKTLSGRELQKDPLQVHPTIYPMAHPWAAASAVHRALANLSGIT